MPITVIPRDNSGDDFARSLTQSMLRFFLQKEDLKLRKDALNQQKREFDLEAQAAEQAQLRGQNALLSLVQGAGQGDPAATATISQMPEVQASLAARGIAGLAGQTQAPAFQGRQFSPDAIASAVRPTPTTPSRLEQTEGAVLAQRALGRARAELARIARETDDPSILSRFEVATALDQAGVDSSVITQTLPPDARERAETGLTLAQLHATEDERQADAFATQQLIQKGIVPEGAPLIPGAGKTLLNVLEARDKRSIDWLNEGLDFITSRIGDNVSGSSFPFVQNPDGTIGIGGGGGQAVSVEQAVAEWKNFVETYAPEPIAKREGKRLESGAFRHMVNRRMARDQVRAILANVAPENRGQTIREIREILKEDFEPETITNIIAEVTAPEQRSRR